uniref:Isopenicillin N synthase-like Fe(2+) 2OG dioxygenase domain-containing protein n=1 Tax=Aegilops tauschii subsp. strangulata TaxID=200361 RepID=A0A453D3I1_AEGTS
MGSVNLSWTVPLKQLQNSSNILLASCPGLEVLDRSSDTWRVVQQPRHALHVHVGDCMEVLSNGRVKTAVHRAVLNHGEARISMASIHSFAMHEKVSVAKELVDEQDPGPEEQEQGI